MTTSLHPVGPSPDQDGGGRSGRAPALPADERRATIIDAATPLLRQQGRDVTTRQIAEAAGIAEGTIFRVFDTKDDLIDAVVAQALDLGATVAKIEAIEPGLPLDERVRACATVLANRLSDVLDLMIALHRHPASPGGGGSTEHSPAHRHTRGFQNPGHGAVLRAVARVLAPDATSLTYRPDRAAHLLWLMVFSGTHRLINAGDQLTPDEIADVFLHGTLRSATRCES